MDFNEFVWCNDDVLVEIEWFQDAGGVFVLNVEI